LQPARDRDLLPFPLTLAWRKTRTDVDLESAQGLDGEGCVLEIPHFLQADDVGGKLCKILVDGANLPIFFGPRSIGPPARKPLNIPKGGGEGGREIAGASRRGGKGGGRRTCRSGEGTGEEDGCEEEGAESGGHWRQCNVKRVAMARQLHWWIERSALDVRMPAKPGIVGIARRSARST
jgi:hypothetical protein